MIFASLHAHDEYSLLDGAGTAMQHAEAARDAGYAALANTNHATLAGSLHHMRACREAGILPISGVEVYYRPNRKVHGQKEWLRQYNHMTVLADGQVGWRSLMRLVSESHRSGFYGRAATDDELLEKHSDGLIYMTGCLGGRLAERILSEDDRGAEAWLRQLIRISNDRVVVEIMPHDIKEQRIVNVEAVRLANKYGLIVATTIDEHYPRQEWAETQDVLLMIATNQSVSKREAKREAGEDVYKFDVQTLYHLTVEEILELYVRHHPDLSYDVVRRSIDDTLTVAAMCRPFLVDKTEKMPVVSFPGEPDNEALLRRLTYEGLVKRGYGDDPLYRERVDFELKTFVDLGAVEQMLMAWDVVDWAKSDRPIPTRDKKTNDLVFDGTKKPIMVGPGRGSAAGCAVSWAVGITNVNPIKHRLLFERFLNPNRKGKPDIDLDFPPERVDEVESYVKVIHGDDRVVDIVAHSTFGPRAALSDVGRVLGVPYSHIKSATKTIDDGSQGSLEDIRLLNPAVDQLASQYLEMWVHACRIQGSVARKSEHAGGILILPGPAQEFISVERKGGQKGKLLSSIGERGSIKGGALISDYGFNKLDVLRVAELTKQQLAVDLYEERTGNRIVLDDLPVHDDPYACEPDVMQGFKDGLLIGVFQFSATAQKLTRQVKPDNIFELAAINALIRPAARSTGADQTYARRKNGEEETTYWHPILEPILGFTYGVVAFQESLMEVVHKLGGLSLAEADSFRKIVSKEYRDPVRSRKIMAEWAPRVKDGFAANGLTSDECDAVWTNTCESFADYAFNLCVSGDTVVERGGAGGRSGQPATITIEDLYRAQESKTAWGAKIRDPKRGVQLLQMDDDGRIRPGRLKRIIHNGCQPVYKVLLESERAIRATTNHRLLASDGYKVVGDLVVGDRLIVEMPREEYGDQYLNGRGRGHAAGKNYEGRGFQDRESNPSWLDGRTQLLNESKRVVRSRRSCQECLRVMDDGDDPHAFEAAHLKTLEQCSGDYLIFHAEENMGLFCNSCHKKLDYKKGERVRRWTRGRPTGEDAVVSVTYDGEEDVFDVEMSTPSHNFLANGIVSHNSHSDGYSILAYRDMYLKIHMPREFYAALLSKGLSAVTKKRISQKAEAVREARHRGLRIMPPDVNDSGRSYTVVDDGIRLGLEAIKHIGPAASAAIEKYRPFVSFEDMEARVPPRHLNVTSRAALVMSGACDRWGKRDRFTEERIDELERELLGMSLTSTHSIAAFADVVEGRFWTEDEFDAAEEGQRVTVVGEVVAVKEHIDVKGGCMAFVDLAYGPNRWSLTVFASLYADYKELLHSRRPILATGSKSTHKGRSGIRVESLPNVDSESWTAPILDLEVFVEMVGGVGDDAEVDAMDSVFPEDVGLETDVPVTI